MTCVKILAREIWLFSETIACHFFITGLQRTVAFHDFASMIRTYILPAPIRVKII